MAQSCETFWELHRKLGECYENDMSGVRSFGVERRLSNNVSKSRVQSGVAMPPPESPGLSALLRGRSTEELLHRMSPGLAFAPHVSNRSHEELMTRMGLAQVPDIPAEERDSSCEALRGSRTIRQRVKESQQKLLSRAGSTESDDSAEGLQPHEIFRFDARKQYTMSTTRRQSKTSILMDRDSSAQKIAATTAAVMLRKDLTIHPAGGFKTSWNICVALCVLHDLLVIPLYVFDPPENVPLKVLEWMTQLFWSGDLFVSSSTGFYDKGTLVLDSKKAFWHYAKTWGLFDLVLVAIGWLFIALDMNETDETQTDLIAWSRTLRALRFLRFVRVLRWLKLRGVAEAFQELFHSNSAFYYYSLISTAVRLLILNHLLACCWWGIALLAEENWARAFGIWESTVMDKYLASLNWAFAMLGVGLSSIKTTNTLEVVFSVLVAFRSLMTYATLISSITTVTSALNKIREDENSEFRLLRSYLGHHDVSQELGQKITRFLQHQYHLRQQARSAHINVPLLELLSPSLRGELEMAKYEKAMRKLPFLSQLLMTDDLAVLQVVQTLAAHAIQDVAAASKDVIFLAGNKANAAYLKLNGSLTYFTTDSEVDIIENLGEETQKKVEEHCWISEICLWASWAYQGDLVADDVSRLIVLNADAFGQIISQSESTHKTAIRYAQTFVDDWTSHGWTDLEPSNDNRDLDSNASEAKGVARCCNWALLSRQPKPSLKILPG